MMKKYKLAFNIFFIALFLVIVKVVLMKYGFKEFNLGPLMSAFITGTIFILGFVLAGTLTDFKESEKLPSELSVSIKSLYEDFKIASGDNKDLFKKPGQLVKDLAADIRDKLNRGKGIDDSVFGKLSDINDEVANYARSGVAVQYITKLRAELSNMERMIKRIKTIKETEFIPAAYAIAEILVGITIVMLVASKIGNYYESALVVFSIPFLMMYMVLLIKDIDDPFEGGSVADVSLAPFDELNDYFRKG